jgi:hypothetical protein
MNSCKPCLVFACCLFGLLWTANVQSADPSSSSSSDKPEVKRVAVGKNVALEIEGDKKRVVIEAEVCLREGPLEQLMTKKATKEHEAILAVDADARHINAALLLTGVKPGSPVKLGEKITPATGPVVKITLRYEEKDKTITVPAKDWLRAAKGKKLPDYDWVFAGSKLVENNIDPKAPPYFLANDGDVICVSNFESALVDLNVVSTSDNDSLNFEANTPKIPAKGTKVTVILETVPEKKDK